MSIERVGYVNGGFVQRFGMCRAFPVMDTASMEGKTDCLGAL